MSTLNRVYLLGTLGSTPALQNARNGKAFCRLSVATDNYFQPGEGEEDKKTTDWHTVHVFGRQAELATQYLEKGRHVLIEGKLFNQTVGEGDKKKWLSWINADRVTFIGGKPRAEFSTATTSVGADTEADDFRSEIVTEH